MNPEYLGWWRARIGDEGTEALARTRRLIMPAWPGVVLLGIGAGFAFRGDTAAKLLGVVLVAVAASLWLAWGRAQRRLAAAVSRWFGVKITARQLPPMRQRTFDAWCERHELAHDRRPGADSEERVEPDVLMTWRQPNPPELEPDERMLWSERGYLKTQRGLEPGLLCVSTQRVVFAFASLARFAILYPPNSRHFSLSDLLSVDVRDDDGDPSGQDRRRYLDFRFRGGESLLVAVEEATEALGKLRGLLPVHSDA
jgi:hypothetical protein